MMADDEDRNEVGSDDREDLLDSHYRAAAREKHQKDGEVEIDDDAPISRGSDPGAYVAAWVWVYNDDVNPQERCGEDTRTARTVSEITDTIDRRVDAMLTRPTMYAKSPDVLEARVLELLSVRESLREPLEAVAQSDQHETDLVENRYKKWCDAWGRVERFPAMVESLKNFVNEERQR